MRLVTVLLSVALPVACSSSNRTTDSQIAGQTTSSGGGTEAAAATAAAMIGGGTTPLPQFVVDRPFFFFIRDATGALLFAGQVVDPTAN